MSLIDTTILFVKQQLQNAETGHDWFHIQRVYKNALHIAQTEKCNLMVVQLAALLHDIADSKFYNGNESIGPTIARDFLESQKTEDAIIQQVVTIIENISFKGGNCNPLFWSIELAIVQDADRLDAIGAIGVARTFNYGGYKNRTIYDPNIAPKLNYTKEEYKKSEAPTINHFYEKLLLLKDKMHTDAAKKIALQRHKYMEGFLSQFYAEWDAEL